MIPDLWDDLGPSSDPALSEHALLEVAAVHDLGRSLEADEPVPGCACETCEIRLWDFQLRAVEQLRANIRAGVKNQILCAPTGAGKTIVATYLIRECYEKGKRGVFLADRKPLIDQTSEVFDTYGIPHGVIQADHWRWQPHQRIQVASPQTLERRKWPSPVDLIVVDEAHTVRKVTHTRIAPRDCVTIGLTATPFTKGLGQYYDAVVSVTTTDALIREGRLAPFRVFAPSEPDMTGVKVNNFGEWSDGETSKRAMPIVGDCVREYLDKANGRKFIAFGADIAHCEEIRRQFMAAGITVELYTSQTPDEERRAILREYRTPNSYIRGLASVAALSKGFDVQDVSCIIMARPLRKSLAEHIQILGRGLRADPADPSKECLARGTLILTQRGEVPIETLSLRDRVWDGVEFVSHGGAICKGVKLVIEYHGLTATPDHPVWTAEGWRAFGECAAEQIPIVQTGIGGRPIRERDHMLSGSAVGRPGVEQEGARLLPVWGVRGGAVDLAGQLATRQNEGLRTVQPAVAVPAPQGGAAVAVRAREGHVRAMHEPEALGPRALRREGDSVQVPIARRCSSVDHGKPWPSDPAQGGAARQDRQRRPLRARQPAVGHPRAKYGEPEEQHHAPFSQVPPRPSGDFVRGSHLAAAVVRRAGLQRDHGAVPPAVRQAEREVWDILNCGPRNRFTAQGLLVHNCLVLDHAGNMLRFWDDMQDFFTRGPDALDDGKKRETKPKPPKPGQEKARRCPKCAHVHAARPSCPMCGHEYPRPSRAHLDGQLVEMGGGAVSTRAEKQSVYSGLLWIAQEKGRRAGWAAHRYAERFGAWPRGLADVPLEPTEALRRWSTSRDIAFAKAQQKAKRAG